MAVPVLLAVLLIVFFAGVWAATPHHAPTWVLGDKALKAHHHANSRVYEFYSNNAYEACQHHPQLGWLHLHRRVSNKRPKRLSAHGV